MSDDTDTAPIDWEGMWKQPGKPPFDASKSAPSLVHLLEQRPFAAGGKALVPGCGRGYDVVSFVKAGLIGIGLDVSPTAVEQANEYLVSQGVDTTQGRVLQHDFYQLPKSFHGQYDVVYDYTFLCATPPGLRPKWAETMSNVLKPDGEVITLIFPIDAAVGYGPPFRMSPELITSLLAPKGFTAIYCEPVPHHLSHPSRAGREILARWRRTSP